MRGFEDRMLMRLEKIGGSCGGIDMWLG